MSNGVFDGLYVIDADTHLTEPHDLWSSRAPARWRDRVPKVVEVGGWPTWVFDGVSPAGGGVGGGRARRAKVPGTAFCAGASTTSMPGRTRSPTASP